MKTYSNPDPRLHVDYLKQQRELLLNIRRRKVSNSISIRISSNYDSSIKSSKKDIEEVEEEVVVLNKLIEQKENYSQLNK